MGTFQSFARSHRYGTLHVLLTILGLWQVACTSQPDRGPRSRQTYTERSQPFLVLPNQPLAKLENTDSATEDGGNLTPQGDLPLITDAATPDDNAQNTASDPIIERPGGGQPLCDRAVERAQAVLEQFCLECHGQDGRADGELSDVMDVATLVSRGDVVPGAPDGSPLLESLVQGTMPPPDHPKRPAPAEIDAVRDWILCGASGWNAAGPPSQFIDVNTRLHTVLDALRGMPNVAERQRQRFVDLTGLSNAGYSAAQIQLHRDVLSFLLNSLSRGKNIAPPSPIDDQKLIYRFDLRDYVWDADTWNLLEREYLYAARYNRDSLLFPIDEDAAEQIRTETDTEIPLIQADWLISHASRPPLYHRLLDLPRSLRELEDDLGVDIQEDIDTQQVLRAGFPAAPPTLNNRVIERHEVGGSHGGLWVTYDFVSSRDESNVFTNPLDFRADVSALLFNLDNGLQAYLLVDAMGDRLDAAPAGSLQDPGARGGVVETGISCMTCHGATGVLPRQDEVRALHLSAGASAAEIERVVAVYGPQEALAEAFSQDSQPHTEALATLGVDDDAVRRGLRLIDDTHAGLLGIDVAASIVGIPTGELERAIDASPQTFPSAIVTLRTQGGAIQRDAFDDVVGDLMVALGLGEQLLAPRPQPSSSAPPPSAPPPSAPPFAFP